MTRLARFVGLAALASAGFSSAADAKSPSTIGASDLCADLYVAAIAPPSAIVAVSWQAGDPIALTPAALRDRPRAWTDAERLLSLDAELIVAGPAQPPRRADLLDRFGREVLSLAWVEDFDGVRANLLTLGERSGREAVARSAVADLDARLAALEARARTRGRAPSVLYLTPTGGTAGADTFVDAAILAAGGRNAAAANGVQGWGRLGAEALLTTEPDLVATSFFDPGYFSVADRARRQKGFRRLLDDRALARVEIPAGLWPCASPRLIDAAERLADALDVLPGEAR